MKEIPGCVAGFVGPEGSGKSLAMCAFALKQRARGLPVLTYPGWFIQDGRPDSPGKGERWSQDIDPAQALVIQNIPKGAALCIDEIPQFYDSAVYGMTTSRLFGYVGAQRRKANLTIYYTAQNWMHVHPRIRWATHYLIVCRDQFWDPKAREEGRQRGEFVNLSCWDIKGFSTGEEWSPMGRSSLFAHHYWGYYDSYGIVDIADGLMQVETKKKKVIYNATGDGRARVYRPGDYDTDAPPPTDEAAQDLGADAELVNQLAESGTMNAAQLAKVKRGLARGRK